MAETRLTFGEARSGVTYRPRLAAYLVTFGDGGTVAAVRGRSGFFLPGGGGEEGETPEDMVRREVREELGREVGPLRFVGVARQLFAAGAEGHFDMTAAFFAGEFSAGEASRAESGAHWLPVAEAEAAFFHACHAWAVRRAVEAREG